MKNNEIVIFGASGQAKNIALIIEHIGKWKILGFVDKDDYNKGEKIMGYINLGGFSGLGYDKINCALAIGDPNIAEKVVDEIKKSGKQVNFPNLIHPSAVVDEKRVEIGEGNVINGGCVFTTDITIGNFNYFNRLTGLSHDTTMGDYCLVHACAAVSGGCVIGDKVQIGTGASIKQDLRIGSKSIVGAGAVVVKNVEEGTVVVGNPAKVMIKK